MSVPRGWLEHVVDESFARPAHDAWHGPRNARIARRVVHALGSHRGLFVGVPRLREGQRLARDVRELFPLVRMLAVVAELVQVAHDVSDSAVPPRHAFLHALARVYGSPDDVIAVGEGPRVARALLSLERALLRRRYLTGNPMLGLTLHHGLLAIDARALVTTSMDALLAVRDVQEPIAWPGHLAAQRRVLTGAIARLSSVRDDVDSALMRQTWQWQLKSFGLSSEEQDALLDVAGERPAWGELVVDVPTSSRSSLFAHTALAAHLDGRVSSHERVALDELGAALALPPRVQARIRHRLRALVRERSDDLNPLTLAAGFAAAGPPVSVRVARALSDNLDALWTEIRQTGDLAVLLARRASGRALNDDEQRRMREQLIDVAKAVPGLAVFALPGGFVLLPLLLKVLPFDLRPRAFAKQDEFHTFARDDDDAMQPDDVQAPEHRFWRRGGA